MKLNLNIFQNFLKILFIFLLLSSLVTTLDIYQDHISPGDEIFNKSQVYDTTNERFYYSLGYYTEKTDNYISKKYGVYFEPVKCTELTDSSGTAIGSLSYSSIDESSFVNRDKVIFKPQSTLNKDANYFEEVELFKNTMTGYKFYCPSGLKIVHNKDLTLTYTIPVISTVANPKLTIHIGTTSPSQLICDLNLEQNKLKMVTIKITTKITNIYGHDIEMFFECTGTSQTHSIVSSGDTYFNFYFNKDSYNRIILSNYRLTVEDSFSKTGISYNTDLVRSKNGLISTQGCTDKTDCFRGHMCLGGLCKRCHFSCIECRADESNNNANSACEKCDVLSNDINPSSGQCETNYVDISQFNNINVEIIPEGEEYNDRATIGFWIFFSDLTSSRSSSSDIYHVVLENRIVISLVPGDDRVVTYCHAYEDLYRKVTSDTKLHTEYKDTNSEYVLSEVVPDVNQMSRMETTSLNGKWFHVSCAISFDHEKFYLKTIINGQSQTGIKNPLIKELLYPASSDVTSDTNLYNDVYYSHILNKGSSLVLKILNFGYSTSKIYMRNLMFFREYMSPEMNYMYFDFSKTEDFKEIMYQIPFDLLQFNPYQIKGYQYDSGSKVTTIISLELSSGNTDFRPPLNFKRLLLPDPNKYYTRIDLVDSSIADLTTTASTTITDYLYLYDANKILVCDNTHYYFQNTCVDNCYPNKYIPYQGVSDNTGYCDYKCDESFVCEVDHFTDKDLLDYDNENFCKERRSIAKYNLFFKCVDNNEDYYLQFSGFYNTQLMRLDLNTSLKSYIIDFWFYPDFFLQSSSKTSQFSFTTYDKNFFFHSNVMDMYFVQTDKTIPYMYDGANYIQVKSGYSQNEWNKFTIYGKYDSITLDYQKTVYVNHNFDKPFSFSAVKYSGATDLSTIIFCENDCSDINGNNIHWTTGYYKDLRIWDGDSAGVYQVVQYDQFYPSSFIKRVSSILYHFPFSNEYISNNNVIDIDDDTKFFKITTGDYFLKKYNYGSNFDIIYGKYKRIEKGYYAVSGSDPPHISECNTGCKRCWERTLCYKCLSGYFLSGRTCVSSDKYFFRSPNGSGQDVTVNYNQDNDAVTVCFWTKPIGFSSITTQTMVSFGKSNSNTYIILQYSADINDNYGLTLGTSDVNGNLQNVIANDRNFRDKIGKWTFISIAYHKKISNYFPEMMKFEINTDSFEITTINIPTNLRMEPIVISDGYYGLFSTIKYYAGYYVIQAIIYEKESDLINNKNPFKNHPKSLYESGITDNGLKCVNGKYQGYDCVQDEEPDMSFFESSCKLLKDYSTTENNCMNICSGNNGWESCTCYATNKNSQMIMKNGNKNYCRPLDYINFAGANPITITNVDVPDGKQKLTLQFWVYIYIYDSDYYSSFGGITVEWVNFNKIEIFYNSGSFYFKCVPLPQGNPELKYKMGINQWTFLSCAIDAKKGITYINYNTQDDFNEYEEGTYSGTLSSVTSSSLKITDSNAVKDWGVLFFRQIRLWKDAYFNADFLSRVDIKTQSKFENLLNAWEPTFIGNIGDDYSSNFKLTDYAGSANTFTITYSVNSYDGKYGMNVIDEDKYKILTLCNEDGLYFDKALQKCLQFLDVSKMKDIEITKLPSSYSGSYSMAFWVFFEDSTIYTVEKELNLIWSRHMQIAIVNDDGLKAYCFPQGYYVDYLSTFQDKKRTSINKAETSLFDVGEEDSGKWIYVVCANSYYNRIYYLQGNKDGEPEILEYVSEDISTNSDSNLNTSYPMRYYLSEITNSLMYKSTFQINKIQDSKTLYFRSVYLFRNYIPYWYAKRIKYMNLKMITDSQLPTLLFVINFADFNLETKILKYRYFERAQGLTTYAQTDSQIELKEKNVGSSFALSANFKFQPLCDLSTVDFKKYNVTSNECVNIKECILQDIHAEYCMEENMPLTCSTGYYLTAQEIQNNFKILCENDCEKEEYLTPGTLWDRGICNVECPLLSKQMTNNGKCPIRVGMQCPPDTIKIGYKCVAESENEKSALFFGKCYNSPNFYRTIGTSTQSQLSKGYFYEFWVKIDNDLNQCDSAAQNSKEYYLYSYPHSIYLNRDENIFYYQIIDSSYRVKLDKIDTTTWNKIIIETNIETLSQDAYIYQNFEKDYTSIESISTNTPLKLQYISFCSRPGNGDCTPGSSNIMWGSAYYRNIRVWDRKTSTIHTIQDFNNGLFSEIPKSLVLYYPLSIKYIDENVITETISKTESIKVTHSVSNNFQSDDNVIFYNYELNLDWKFKHENNDPNKLFVYEDLKDITGYYLKVPASTAISFDISNLSNQFTFCIYMKFIGIINTGTSASPVIFSFLDDTFIAFEISSSNLVFYIGGSDKEAFRDSSFHDYIGKWTPICIANYRSTTPYIFPHMFTMNVNKIDIPFSTGFSISDAGIKFNRIQIGEEIIAYFYDFRIYSHFIQGNFATIISQFTGNDELFIHYTLKCSSNTTNDVHAAFTSNSTMKPNCVGDYNIYDDNTTFCTSDDRYYDRDITTDEKCEDCESECKTLCFNNKNTKRDCTCDVTESVYWLRKHEGSSVTYCEHPPYIDYSLLETINITVPTSNTNESSIEFWFYIYSYNTTKVKFKEINIIWNKHNRVQIINNDNSLSAICYALWDVNGNEDKYSQYTQTLSVTGFSWTSIRCGSTINLPTYKYFLNTYESTMSIETQYLPYDRVNSNSHLIIDNGSTNPASYGFLFIRELKLWQQYNINYIDTSYIILDKFGYYDLSTKASSGAYPGLITLIRSEYDIEEYKNAIDRKYYLTNIIINGNDTTAFDSKYELHRKDSSFIGYNIIDPTNSAFYKKLELCSEGQVYNSLLGYCDTPSYTKCKYPGDTKDTCIQCLPTEIFIYPVDGTCVSECPTGYFPREDINQCRPCEETCYKCSWLFEFNCTQCIGERYLVEEEHRCVLFCEDYNLTASNITENLCTEFYANASLINYDEIERTHIDINTFEKLVAKVTNYTSKGYTVLWGFDKEATIELNQNNSGVVFPTEPTTPFIGPLDKEEEVLVNNTFFQLSKKYMFYLTIIAHNVVDYNKVVTQRVNFTIMINCVPVNGTLTVFPDVGLYKVTYFVFKCENFTDDTSPTDKLLYRFYSQEVGTPIVNELRGWSLENEISTNFSVIYYQKDSSDINVYCDVKDELNATATVSTKITIAKSLTGGIYNLSNVLINFTEPTETDSNILDVLYYHRSLYLVSLGIDQYKTVYPSFYQTKYESSIDGLEITKEDPSCVSDYCNGKGNCVLVDEFVTCHCTQDFVGKYCHVDTNGIDVLEGYYVELLEKIVFNDIDPITYYKFMVIYNLFKGASLFIRDETFFTERLESFLTYAIQSAKQNSDSGYFSISTDNNTYEYLDLIDFYYSYEMMRMEQLKAKIQADSNTTDRNVTFPESLWDDFKAKFENLNQLILDFSQFLAGKYASTRRKIIYEKENYYLAIVPVNPSFDDTEFFDERRKAYKTYVDFMTCLNYVEMERLSNPYYTAYLVYIEYHYFPFSYNTTLLVNNTSPMVEMKIVDSTSNNYISIKGCKDSNAIVFHMPFTSYRFLQEVNYQKDLYDPKKYKGPDDPIFKDPIYINDSGYVSDDTVEQRIEKYNRRYNISPRYYNDEVEGSEDFILDGLTYKNFTGDYNFIEFTSTHLTRFTNFMIPNNATFKSNGRFFYLFRPQVIKWLPNYYQSFAPLIFFIFLVIYLFLLIAVTCYDKRYTNQEQLLDYIKIEIVKNYYPYSRNKDLIVQRLVPKNMDIEIPGEEKDKNKFTTKRKIIDPRARAIMEEQEVNPTEKQNILNANKKTTEDMIFGEETKNNDEKDDKKKNKKVKSIRNNFFIHKSEKVKKKEEEKKKELDEDEKSQISRELGNVNRAVFRPNNLPKNFEDLNVEYNRRLENYEKLRLTTKQFFKHNMKLRSTFINAVFNVSLFHPRWKKLTMILTEIALMIFVISIALTFDGNAKLKINLIKIGNLVGYAIIAMIISNCLMYFVALFFVFPQELARRLYKLVLFNGQLIVLKEWDDIVNSQGKKAFWGVIICIIFWTGSLYVGLGFTAVWSDQKWEFLICFGFAFIFNFFIFELIVEAFICIFYYVRKKSLNLKKFGLELNRLRNNRCLAP